jgi:pyruvate, water dikinase
VKWNFKYKIVIFLFTVAIIEQGCKSPKGDDSSLEDNAPLKYKTELRTRSDMAQLEGSFQKWKYVKFSFDFTKEGKPVYFQNTALYPFHQNFLSTEIEAYKGVPADTIIDLMFDPEPKVLTLGALYYADSLKFGEQTLDKVLGVNIYFDRDQGLKTEEVKSLFAHLKETAPFAGNLVLAFEAAGDLFKYKATLNQAGIKSVLATAFSQVEAKPTTYNPATSYGYLKQLTQEEFDRDGYTSKDILILESTPLDIGPLSGVITWTPQVPNSHVVLRTINQKIPNMYIPKTQIDANVGSLIGKLVKFESREDGTFAIHEGNAAEAEKYFSGRVPPYPDLQFDLAQKELLFWQSLTDFKGLVKAYGAKVTNFAVFDNKLRKKGIDRSDYQGSFAIPLFYYNAHLQNPLTSKMCEKSLNECKEDYPQDQSLCVKVNRQCQELAAKKQTLWDWAKKISGKAAAAEIVKSIAVRRTTLVSFRKAIEVAPLNQQYLNLIVETLKTRHPQTWEKTRFRFRSSTNAEDLPGLNGAGLYVSKPGCIADENADDDGESACMTPREKTRTLQLIQKLRQENNPKNEPIIKDLEESLTKKHPISKAIRKVYASVWGEKAFLNRDYYGLNHLNVYMAMLVHPSFTDETGNGVALVRPGSKPNSPSSLEMRLVMQKDDISITNPEIIGAIPDQFTFVRKGNGQVTDPVYVTTCNQNGGKHVMTLAQIQSAARQLAITYGALQEMFNEGFKEGGSQNKFTGIIDAELKLGPKGDVIMKQARPL